MNIFPNLLIYKLSVLPVTCINLFTYSDVSQLFSILALIDHKLILVHGQVLVASYASNKQAEVEFKMRQTDLFNYRYLKTGVER